MDDQNMDFTEEELASMRELEAAHKAETEGMEDDDALPELDESSDEHVSLSEDYAHMTDEEVVHLCQQETVLLRNTSSTSTRTSCAPRREATSLSARIMRTLCRRA